MQYAMSSSSMVLSSVINDVFHSSLSSVYCCLSIIDYFGIAISSKNGKCALRVLLNIALQIIHYQNHTYRILSPSFHYDSRGSYLNFAYFNVEQRNRVLAIDSLYGIDCSIEEY